MLLEFQHLHMLPRYRTWRRILQQICLEFIQYWKTRENLNAYISKSNLLKHGNRVYVICGLTLVYITILKYKQYPIQIQLLALEHLLV